MGCMCRSPFETLCGPILSTPGPPKAWFDGPGISPVVDPLAAAAPRALARGAEALGLEVYPFLVN